MKRSFVYVGPLAAAVGVMVLSAGGARAATISVEVNAADAEVSAGGASNQTKVGTILAGTFNATALTAVFPFPLPVIPSGETILTANLDVTANRNNAPTFNADLYGLGFRNAATVLAGDFFTGPLDATDATLIQNDQFTPATPTAAARAGTSAAGDAALAAYLNAQYQAGAVGGTSFAFLRYSPDFVTNPGTASSGTLGYPVSTQETGTATRAVLTITTGVPEPTSAAALGLAGVGLLARRRRGR